MAFEFVLFAILGWLVFAPPANERGRMVLMIVFVVLMALWVLAGATGWHIGWPNAR